PEFLASTERNGRAALERIARITGGDYLAKADRAFEPEGATAAASTLDLRPLVALLLLLVFLAETAERRLGVLGLLRRSPT
ncbi:MAG: hypothetical protein ACOCX4_03095, partial [Planctomycetota bacterium]